MTSSPKLTTSFICTCIISILLIQTTAGLLQDLKQCQNTKKMLVQELSHLSNHAKEVEDKYEALLKLYAELKTKHPETTNPADSPKLFQEYRLSTEDSDSIASEDSKHDESDDMKDLWELIPENLRGSLYQAYEHFSSADYNSSISAAKGVYESLLENAEGALQNVSEKAYELLGEVTKDAQSTFGKLKEATKDADWNEYFGQASQTFDKILKNQKDADWSDVLEFVKVAKELGKDLNLEKIADISACFLNPMTNNAMCLLKLMN